MYQCRLEKVRARECVRLRATCGSASARQKCVGRFHGAFVLENVRGWVLKLSFGRHPKRSEPAGETQHHRCALQRSQAQTDIRKGHIKIQTAQSQLRELKNNACPLAPQSQFKYIVGCELQMPYFSNC